MPIRPIPRRRRLPMVSVFLIMGGVLSDVFQWNNTILGILVKIF